jgi:hypothetical protein
VPEPEERFRWVDCWQLWVGNRTLTNGGAGEIPERRSDGNSCTVRYVVHTV